MYSLKPLVDAKKNFAEFGTIGVKYLSKFSAIDFVSAMFFLSTMIFLGKFCCLRFSFTIASLMTCQVFFILFLYFSINFEKYSFFDCFSVILILFSVVFFRTYTLLPFFIPLAIQRFPKSFSF